MPFHHIVYRRRSLREDVENVMMGTSHAVSGAALWLTGWSWAAVAGLAQPRLDVLTVGTAVCAGAALYPDFDHRRSRMAKSGGRITYRLAKWHGIAGAGIHKATRLAADRPDFDGHRTVTHTLVFGVLMGTLVAGLCGLPGITGKIIAAVLVYAFTQLGYLAVRASFNGRRKKIRFTRRGRRWHKSTVVSALAAVGTLLLVRGDVWWLGLAFGAGCVIHCLGDVITASGCPILWPLPIPSRETRYDRKLRARVPVRRWRTWYLVGSPRWMRFPVGSPSETRIRVALIVWTGVAVAGLVYAGGWVQPPS